MRACEQEKNHLLLRSFRRIFTTNNYSATKGQEEQRKARNLVCDSVTNILRLYNENQRYSA